MNSKKRIDRIKVSTGIGVPFTNPRWNYKFFWCFFMSDPIKMCRKTSKKSLGNRTTLLNKIGLTEKVHPSNSLRLFDFHSDFLTFCIGKYADWVTCFWGDFIDERRKTRQKKHRFGSIWWIVSVILGIDGFIHQLTSNWVQNDLQTNWVTKKGT